MITSVPVISLLLVLFFIAAIVIAFVRKVNVGIVGLAFAIILAALTGLKFNNIVSAFPASVVITIFSVTLFFGYFAENGTIEYMANSIMHRFCKNSKLIPYAFFLMAMLLAAVGGCDMVVFSAAVTFPIGKAAGMKAHQTGCTTMLGSMLGSFLPWSLHGSTAKSIIETMNDGFWADSANTIAWGTWLSALVFYLIIVTVCYFAFKSYKLADVEMPQPAPATPIQKKSLVIILIAFCFIVIVPILKNVIGGAFLGTVSKFCGVAPVCLIGALVNTILKIGNEKDVMKKRIPWNTITMLFGMGMLLGLGSVLGVNDYLGELAQQLPASAVVLFFVLLAGAMSLFSSTLSVVYPTLLPLAGALAMTGAVSPVAVMAGIVIGSATTAMSPLSTAGGLLLSGCPESIVEGNEIFNKMLMMAVICMAGLAVAAIIGMFGLWGLIHV